MQLTYVQEKWEIGKEMMKGHIIYVERGYCTELCAHNMKPIIVLYDVIRVHYDDDDITKTKVNSR